MDVAIIGQLVADRYRVEARLGDGGRGTVYRARDIVLDRDVALKVLRRSADAETEAQFQREAQLVARLEHRHIVPVYDVGRWDRRLFFTMPVIEGSSLRAILRRGALHVETALELCAQLAEALELSHARGIVHRDLKPENVLVSWTESGRPRAHLLDFGIAEVLGGGPREASAEFVGTIRYASPAQLRSQEADARCDVWSLGVLLYEMLDGRPPFTSRRMMALCVEILSKPVPSLVVPGLDRRVVELVRRCLERDPSLRPESMTQVVDVLRDVLAAEDAPPAVEEAAELFALAGQLLVQADYETAQMFYERACRRLDDDAWRRSEADLQLARLAMLLGRTREAVARCDAVIERFADDSVRRAVADGLAALALVASGEIDRAVVRLERGRRTVHAAPPGTDLRRAEVTLLRAAGNLWLARGEPLRALGAFLESLDVLESSKEDFGTLAEARWEMSIALYNGAEAFYRHGDIEAAERFLDRAQAIKTALGDRWGLAHLHALRARILLDSGRARDARRDVEIARAIAEVIGDPRVGTISLLLDGRLAMALGDESEARRQLRAALDRAEASGCRMEAREALSLLRAGATNARLGTSRR